MIAQLDAHEGVLLLTDQIGATPSNIERLYQPGRTKGVAGVNLPMLLRALCYSGKPLAEVAQKALDRLDSGPSCVFPIIPDSGSCDVTTRCTNN